MHLVKKLGAFQIDGNRFGRWLEILRRGNSSYQIRHGNDAMHFGNALWIAGTRRHEQ
jgi:hypothetical protein